MNIYEKMLKATEQINKVAKNLKVGVGQAQYKAVGEADVLEAVKPIEIELGIYSYPLIREIIETNVFTTTSEYKGEVKEKNSLFMRLKTVYRFVNVENPEEYIDITTFGDGVDAQDKAPGKAMTYSDKYALLKAYKIETGDDPDQHASGQLATKKIGKNEKDAVVMGLERTGVREEQILKLVNVKKIEDMNLNQWQIVMSKLKVTPDKKV